MSPQESGLILIGRSGAEHVSINITARDKENWLSGILEVRAGAWSGCCRVTFQQGELRQLAKELEKLYSSLVGPLQFTPMEPYLEMKFSGNGKGSFEVEGTARESLSDDTHLSFRLDLDQTEFRPSFGR